MSESSEPFVIDDGNEVDEDMDEVESDDDYWHGELEEVLNDGLVDHGIIRNICKCRVLPPVHRANVWKICLGVTNRGNALLAWDGKTDLSNQRELHDDCQSLVDSIDVDFDFDRTQMLTDIEAILTFYCKSKAIKYSTNNHWTDILRPFLMLENCDRADLYNFFYAIISKYIPNEGRSPYDLFRLLLQYHDPELCSFLDSKKITADICVDLWLSTLFSHHCGSKGNVAMAIWDVYFQRGDPYFVFFLALVILVNAKETVMTSQSKTRDEIISVIAEFPCALEHDDVEDFCHLSAFYSDKTPRSFKKDYREVLFGNTLSSSSDGSSELSQAFCLHVEIPELLMSTQPLDPTDESCGVEQVHFFMVDCRPAERYNAAHLVTAFHLDASLMLTEPSEFAIAITALFNAQKQAIESGSLAGGEHLCFIGTGDQEADQYMYMVVANLLQKHKLYISVAKGGFEAILEYLQDVNIDLSEWIVGTEDFHASPNTHDNVNKQFDNMKIGQESSRSRMEGFVKSLSTTIKTKSLDLKDKAVRFIENQDVMEEDRHVRLNDHTKAYRGTQPVFSIGDEVGSSDNESTTAAVNARNKKAPAKRVPSSDSEVDESDLLDLDEYLAKENVTKNFPCFRVLPNGRKLTAHVAIEGDYMVCLREYKKKGRSKVISRRYLGNVTKITSKRSCPELITFKFGTVDNNETTVEFTDRYLIPDAGQATKQIKQEIVRVLDSATESQTTS